MDTRPTLPAAPGPLNVYEVADTTVIARSPEDALALLTEQWGVGWEEDYSPDVAVIPLDRVITGHFEEVYRAGDLKGQPIRLRLTAEEWAAVHGVRCILCGEG